jgi:acyl-coenzyme A synthetase/AMP-(fatty) acid ligase
LAAADGVPVDAETWTPFSSAAVEADSEGRLRVRSPFVSAPDGVFTLADRVDVQRRAVQRRPARDRVVKVGDKRVSLPEMEAVLAEHELVSQAALVVLDHGTACIGAAVVPTPAGRQLRRGKAVARSRRR